jgi:hypothetical protein
MNTLLCIRSLRSGLFFGLLFVALICGNLVHAAQQETGPEPALYLNFDETGGNFALDGSGNGNAGTLHNMTRIDSVGCGRALLFSQPDSYVAIPYRSQNHPAKAITVSAWFYLDEFRPGVLVSAYHDGGYRLGFDDGNDLWWTVNLDGTGDVSVPVRYENIAPHQWHQVTGTYDGHAVRIYLDGVLRNQVNATGAIQYQAANYVFLGAESGAYDTPALSCPRYFHGGLDEVRIYPVSLTYGQVMDDRFRCSEGAGLPPASRVAEREPSVCESLSGAIRLGGADSVVRILSFPENTANATWQVSLPPGSTLRVRATDAYAKASPDSWYLEISDESGKLARTIAFPNRNNAPAEAVLPRGNATVLVKYFDGSGRFPATVTLTLEAIPPLPLPQIVTQNILANPIIVIYSTLWATLIAIIVVMIWLHRRRNVGK